MTLLTLSDIEKATPLVYSQMAPTPQYLWPQICDLTGATVWVKHENHTPTGAFKVRGGITFIDWLKRSSPDTKGIVTATRGNHGQSQARAATTAGLTAKIVDPHHNSVEKNAAMRSFGGTVIEHGNDFDEARLEAQRLAEVENLVSVPPFHPEIVRGVATYALELFTAIKDMDTDYVSNG